MKTRALPLLFLGLVVAQAVAASPPQRHIEKQTDENQPPIDADLLRRHIRMVGYGGLDRTVWERDKQRAIAALGGDEKASFWPTRDVPAPGSLEKFPARLDSRGLVVEAVPLYVIVDPTEIDIRWGELNKKSEPETKPTGKGARPDYAPRPKEKYPSLDDVKAMCITLYIESFQLPTGGVFRTHWPTWADSALPGQYPKYPDIGERRWSALATTGVGFPNALVPALRFYDTKQVGMFQTWRVSESAWCVVPPTRPPNIYETQRPRGEIVFPLWESVGLLRDAAADPWINERTGPMSSHVESPDVEWRFESRQSFVFVEPMPSDFRFTREYVVMPEVFAKQPIPVFSVYKAATWKPFAEDFVFRVGPPTTGEGLRAVCVFMTCTDEQLKSVAAAMEAIGTRAGDAAPAKPEKPR